MSDFGQYASGILGNTGEEKETFSSYANQLLKAPAQEKTKSEPTQNVLTDTAQDVIQGTLRIPGAITGLADIPAGLMGFNRPFDRATDYIGEKTGIQPGKLADSIQAHNYSPERMASDVAVNKAWNSEDTGLDYAAGIAKAYAQNPRSLLGNVVGSVPSMYAGGMLGNASRAAGLVSKANVPFVGEGAVMAGQAMDNIDASVDPQKAAILSAATGLGGGLLARGGGKLSEKMGLVDPDVAIANGLSQTATKEPMGLGARTAGGFLAEGAMEELPQSLMEQGLQNYAEDKPLTEGMVRAGVEGLLSGGLMGAGFNALPQSTPKIVEKPISDGPLGNAAAAGGITQTEISDAGTTNQEALIPEQNLGGSSGAVLPASNGLGEPNDAMPEPESLVDQTGAATTGNEAEPAIATQQAPSPVDFQPTHLADDGTPVAYREDDQGPYFETADGQQWNYTDTATPITQEVQNANSPTGSVAENNPPITGQDSGIGSDQRGFDTSLEPTDGRADDRGISGVDGQLRGAELPSDVESGGALDETSTTPNINVSQAQTSESELPSMEDTASTTGITNTATFVGDASTDSNQPGGVEPEAAARDKAFNDVYQLFTNLKDGFNKGAELAETEGNESLLKQVRKHAINQLSQITDKKSAARIADFLLEEGNINNELEWINHADIETAVSNLAERYAKQTPETQPVLPDTGANQTGNAPTVGTGQGQSAVSGQEEVGAPSYQTAVDAQFTQKSYDTPTKALGGMTPREYGKQHVEAGHQFVEKDGKYYLKGDGAGMKQIPKATYLYGSALENASRESGDYVAPETTQTEPTASIEEVNAHGVTRQPRLAESADELYKKSVELSTKGHVLPNGRIVYPVVNTLGDGVFQYTSSGEWVKWKDNTGASTSKATKSDIENIHHAFDTDTAQIEARMPWGQAIAGNSGKVEEVLHSPRGNSFKQNSVQQAMAGEPLETPTAETTTPLFDKLDKSKGIVPATHKAIKDHPNAERIAMIHNRFNDVLNDHGFEPAHNINGNLTNRIRITC